MAAYYNEIDPFAAAWLRELIKHGHIAPGVVDERSIVDVRPMDLAGYAQCHFFAGIGVWSYALRSAGWSDDIPVWTGSCPCQPFSVAGKGKGTADQRHLWPEFCRLIAECRPATVFGEQVASKAGRSWLSSVRLDLEALGYGVGASDLCAAGVGAPHIRQRLYWVADAMPAGWAQGRPGAGDGQASRSGGDLRMADSEREGRKACAFKNLPRPGRGGKGGKPWQPCAAATAPKLSSTPQGFWRDADWLFCRDGKWRPARPGSFPLAHGSPARVGRLCGYGNAINAVQAQAFIEAVMEAL